MKYVIDIDGTICKEEGKVSVENLILTELQK